MRLGRSQQFTTCVLVTLTLCRGDVPAQQPRTESSLPAESVAVRPNSINASGIEGKRLAPTVLSLNALIAEALEQNPEVKAMQRNFDMMRARVPQAKALPEPMLSYGYLGNAAPIPPFDIQKGDSSSGRLMSITQGVPFPGKLALKGRMAGAEAEAEWWNYEQTRLNLIAEVKAAYFDLYYAAKAIETVTRNQELLAKFARIAEAGYAVGKGIQQDVLKVQVEISKLTDQLTVLEQRRQLAEARLNSLLFREPETPVGRPEEIRPRDYSYSLAELNQTALNNCPALKSQRLSLDAKPKTLEKEN
jgi:outer membrane protein TolC